MPFKYLMKSIDFPFSDWELQFLLLVFVSLRYQRFVPSSSVISSIFAVSILISTLFNTVFFPTSHILFLTDTQVIDFPTENQLCYCLYLKLSSIYRCCEYMYNVVDMSFTSCLNDSGDIPNIQPFSNSCT